MSEAFAAVRDTVLARKPELAPCRATLEKEILHVEILRALGNAGLLRGMTFKGGTCLRMCRGGRRLSEDLDFFGGGDFRPRWFDDAENVVRDHLLLHYGMESSMRRREAASNRTVERATVQAVTRPSPNRSTSNIGIQRIKIEVSPIDPPVGSQILQAEFPHRDATLADAAVRVRCVPLASTLADKLVALPASIADRRNPRYRDVWDLFDFGLPPGAEAERVLAQARRQGRQQLGCPRFGETLADASARLPEIVESDGFRTTMQRFLPSTLADQTIDDADCREAMANVVGDMLRRLRESPSHRYEPRR